MKVKNYELELSLILARVYKLLNIKSGYILDILQKDFSQDDLSFFPRLTLAAAQGPKGITNKVRTLAVITQLMYLSTEIHGQVPEKKVNKSFSQEIQLPILTGDYLYSRVFDVICTEECLEYMDELIDYANELNEGWINYLEKKITFEEFYEIWYGKLAARTMGMAAFSSGLNYYNAKNIRKLGLGLGRLYGAKKFPLSSEEIEKSWQIIEQALSLLPPNIAKEILSSVDVYINHENMERKFGEQRLTVCCGKEM